MSARRLGLLAVVALVLVGTAVWLGGTRRAQTGPDTGSRLLPQLEAQLNDIERVRLVGAGDTVLATMARGDAGWTLAERGGYAVDIARLRELLLSLALAQRVEPKTANPELHARLGVEDVAAEDAAGVRVELGAADGSQAIIVGNEATGGSGSYVRVDGDAQSWLTDRRIGVERSPARWLQRELTAIDATRVTQVEIEHADGGRVEIVARDDAPGFAIANLPKGREPQGEYVAEGTAGLLASLRLEDVAPAAEAAPPEDADVSQARYALRNGIVVDVAFWPHEGGTRARFDASLDESRAEAFVTAEQAKAQMEYERSQRAAAREAQASGDGDAASGEAVADAADSADADGSGGAASESGTSESASATDMTGDATDPGAEAIVDAGDNSGAQPTADAPLAVTDPDADRQARMAAIGEERAALEARFDGWVFTLPSYKASSLAKPLDEYLAPND